jgi:hypothetical protein
VIGLTLFSHIKILFCDMADERKERTNRYCCFMTSSLYAYSFMRKI